MTVVSGPQLKKRIMRRVYMIHLLRRVTSPTAIKLYAEVIVLWQIILRVSVGSILTNFWNAVAGGGIVRFLLSMLTRTEILVQTLFVGAILLGAWFVKDIFFNKSKTAFAAV